jgi:twitching motility protein PilT
MTSYDDELSRIVDELNRSGPSGSRTIRLATGQGTSIDPLLGLASRSGASDVLLVAGASVVMRIHGDLTPSTGPLLDGDDIRNLVLPLLDARQQRTLETDRSLDLSFAREGLGRFRLNLHFQRGTLAAAIRLLPSSVPKLDSLHLPAIVGSLADRRQGLILITGASGCGKSTTLAAMIERINSQKRCHIVAIEDPIEYHHSNQKSIVEQIEIGADAKDYPHALRSVLRQNPDVLLIGEMRDPETISVALSAAETGHLVLSTLHTNDAPQAISRILDAFPSAEQSQVRQQISLALSAVVSQQLTPAANGTGRFPAVEIMTATSAVRNLIRKGEDHQLHSQISTGRTEGMITMEQSLAELVRAGRIARETAIAHCFRAADMRRYLES